MRADHSEPDLYREVLQLVPKNYPDRAYAVDTLMSAAISYYYWVWDGDHPVAEGRGGALLAAIKEYIQESFADPDERELSPADANVDVVAATVLYRLLDWKNWYPTQKQEEDDYAEQEEATTHYNLVDSGYYGP